ncbi:trifunctional transcriptional regulator/proline dehydrogenase/L-glutamate gamma-semialdehyde dehydrogenase [Sphingomonadales bacterium 56]|uniref:trifunctional transcriptional regulator/proline dehydrogenase/L-glutamate gamma-semialdehyde dehydrogenase n=1 Tax=unclassified Sphingobium TaxID=2611147 RepID=UPI00191AD1AC|nr:MULTISPECIES: trifunctional transcriptional regulator/proline dehydrogenase/L-glutamate gamma-semialdehyde dehydrogenase [unclassified Sphingobium]MBY2929922.1 trifunctional transcriptional regulator/proline dehydrogenase/L-glutamate gamma-semialdehyde dehydrogenase [Sphingomonadales bacterium 56]MBY2959829.1 trifunctional transcriptional regulator/proline dehydrogenase/L-glutamate gamma-semialdehyde dehydrogenase [Sphingomonadales bacterium 58]CAD7339833.1 Bifunctional protein PutA [Sphingob
MPHHAVFDAFAPPIRSQSPLRQAITAAYRRDEAACVAPLLEAATLDGPDREAIRQIARQLVTTLRAHRSGSGVEALIQEYSLSSEEGVALMCLAEALLRIPDDATRDALIRDKLAGGDWSAHVGGGKSLFVNAATWGLVVTGKLVGSVDDRGLGAALTRLVARAGEPVIRRGVDLAMRMMGEQFVTGETISQALKRARNLEAKGFRYSYDMLGEAAATAADADRYHADYERAIHAIGKAAGGRGIYEGPGISIKLSALHPRYVRAQAERIMGELLPRVRQLALLAKRYDIGLNIDAEEMDRLELSLDLLESLATDRDLAGWDGLGFVIQAYGKRCPFVIEWIIDLARRSGRRIMVRLVKGAYWDAEIKRAQVDGLADFPVYTRKVHTDVAYIACAQKLLAAPDAVFPQFATHNAQTLATIYRIAGPDFRSGQYEFQCLHGMGEPLYEQVVGKDKLDRPCRIYAPVGTHETLLAYLVRRLLENGANSSFVHRIGDPAVRLEDLIADPVELVRAMPHAGARHDQIALPAHIYPDRRNSAGFDLSDEATLAALSQALRESAETGWTAAPTFGSGEERAIVNPADHRDRVGTVMEVAAEDAAALVAHAASSDWGSKSVDERAAILERAADAMQARMPILLGLLMREAGKSLPNAIAEVREAIDFLRYYAMQARTSFGAEQQPLGPIICISPWNFPLAIFTGQVAAALVAGNPVLAKPAGQTPLIAAEAVRLLHEAGIPRHALQLTPGDGLLGSALVSAPDTAGVMFTGSTAVARMIQGELAKRLSPAGRPIPLVAETGGQNAMIVDSSALAEQVVADVLVSAFDSAGQRCSALRVLCLQEEVADRILLMLKGALREMRVGRPDALKVDIGPVITEQAKAGIEKHIARMRERGAHVDQLALPVEAAHGSFVAPTIIEIGDIAELEQEVFGPVLHVVRFRRERLDALIDAINATGYGLTFGLHTRLDETIDHVTARVQAGNLYVNRNMIGAIVGVQPFGGRGLSGTGPKAGGPLYLGRLVARPPVLRHRAMDAASPIHAFADWLEAKGESGSAAKARDYAAASALGTKLALPGPVGESNLYSLHPRGRIGMKPQTPHGLFEQMAAVLATGNRGVVEEPLPDDLPPHVAAAFSAWADGPCSVVLVEGDGMTVARAVAEAAAMPGPIIPVHAADQDQPLAYHCDWLLEEVSVSINTTAAGGNASLMMIG